MTGDIHFPLRVQLLFCVSYHLLGPAASGPTGVQFNGKFLIFDTIVPQDVYFEPFVRVKLSGIRRNAEKKETLIMFQSTANYEIIAEKESFPFTFSVRTLDGTTNIAEFLTENDCKKLEIFISYYYL